MFYLFGIENAEILFDKWIKRIKKKKSASGRKQTSGELNDLY